MKSIALFFVLILSLISIVSALDIQINNNVSLGENVLMKVSGNFLENIQKSDISFYRRHMPTSFANYDVKKIGEDFYIYAMVDLIKIPDNYSIQIKGIEYMKGAVISSETIIGNFSVLNQTADFSLIPGIIKTDAIFSVKIQNLQDNGIVLKATDNSSADYNLKSGEIINLFFDLGNGTRTINFKSENQEYNLIVENPIIISEEINDSLDNESEDNLTDNDTVIIIDENITEEDNKTILDENQSEGNITKNETIDPKDILITNEETGEVKTCAELNGTSCIPSTQKCEGEKQTSDGAECCLGKCINKTSNKSKKIVGWVLIIVIVLIFAWFFLKKYKGTKKKKIDLEKESKEKHLPFLPPPKYP